MPSSISPAVVSLRPLNDESGDHAWTMNGRTFTGCRPVLLELALRVTKGERVMVSCTGRGVGPLRRRNPGKGEAWRQDSEFRVARFLDAPGADVLILASEIRGWACKPDVEELDAAGAFVRRFSPSWSPS